MKSDLIKVIFLDIDGVLNVISAYDDYGAILHKQFTDNLKTLIDETGAKIVLSSSWRKDGLSKIREIWEYRNLAGEIIDITPSLYLQKNGSIVFYNDKLTEHPTPKIRGYSIPRGCEIDYWVKNESSKFGTLLNYVIIDDDTDMLLHHYDKFVKCSDLEDEDSVEGYGLTKNCTIKAIQILNSGNI